MENSVKPPQAKGFQRWWKAWLYTVDGFKAAFQNEAAFREETLAACILVPIAFFLPVSPAMKALMIASVFLVMIVELLNSAIEAVVDKASPERHPLAKIAKDMGSAAVMISVISGACVWLLGMIEVFS